MAENCPLWRVGTCTFSPSGDLHNCSYPSRDFKQCSVHKMAVARAQGGNMLDQLKASGIIRPGMVVIGEPESARPTLARAPAIESVALSWRIALAAYLAAFIVVFLLMLPSLSYSPAILDVNTSSVPGAVCFGLWILGAALAAAVARHRGRRWVRWMVAALLLPLFPHVALASRRFLDLVFFAGGGYALGFATLYGAWSYQVSVEQEMKAYWSPHMPAIESTVDAAAKNTLPASGALPSGRRVLIQNHGVLYDPDPHQRAGTIEDVATIVAIGDRDVTVVDRANARVVDQHRVASGSLQSAMNWILSMPSSR